MENVFLHTVNELEEHVAYLMTDKRASHSLRVLLLILSGLPLDSRRNDVLSRNKEHISVAGYDQKQNQATEPRVVPDSFHDALDKLLNRCVSSLDTTSMRALATHKSGNPLLQLLLQIELTCFGKHRAKEQNSLMHKLLPDDPITPDSESASFVNGLLHDTIGSRLLEAIIQHAPGRIFKNLYKQLFRDRIPKLAGNQTAGYVMGKIIERLGKDDLHDVVEALIPKIPDLTARNRTAVIKTVVDSCVHRKVDTDNLAQALEEAYSGDNGFDAVRLLRLDPPSPHPSSGRGANDIPENAAMIEYHGSLLAQSMLAAPGPLSDLIFDGLTKLSPPMALKCAHNKSHTHVIQTALTSPLATIIFRRKLIQAFYGEIGAMALDPSASHVIDAIWNGTMGLAFIRERIAEELAENEASLRKSSVGRHVWRRWEMDLWKRRRSEWVRKCRESVGSEGFIPFPEDESAKGKHKSNGSVDDVHFKKKTPLELARDKHAAKKAKEASKEEREVKKALKDERRAHKHSHSRSSLQAEDTGDERNGETA